MGLNDSSLEISIFALVKRGTSTIMLRMRWSRSTKRGMSWKGETDWKVIVIDVTDPLASKLNDIEDVKKHLRGLIKDTNEWFR